MTFPTDDPLWFEALQFLRSHVAQGDSMVAPVEFRSYFACQTPASLLNSQSFSDLQWIVLHKGRLDEVGQDNLASLISRKYPVYANEVFVIFTNRKKLSRLSFLNPHYRSFRKALQVLNGPPRTALYPENRGAFGGEKSSVYLGDYRAITENFLGHKMFLDTRDLSLTPHLLLDGHWEMWITKVFMGLLQEGMTVIEIGANVGYYSLIAASLIGGTGKLYTFEANPGTYRLLLDNIKVNGFKERATVVNKAVYSKSGKLPFYCLKHYQGDCRIFDFPDKRLEADMDEGQCIEVDAVALDDFFAQTDIHVDLIKMDAEGSEPYIFTGMETLLSRNKDARVICEFAPALVADAGNNPKEFLQYLLGYGFKLQVIDTASKIVETSIEDVLQSSHCELFLTR